VLLENDKTLLIQSGKPVGIFETLTDAGCSESVQLPKSTACKYPLLH